MINYKKFYEYFKNLVETEELTVIGYKGLNEMIDLSEFFDDAEEQAWWEDEDDEECER